MGARTGVRNGETGQNPLPARMHNGRSRAAQTANTSEHPEPAIFLTEWLIKRPVAPAPGYRASGSGLLRSVGTSGSSWASSITNSDVYYLGLGSSGFYTNDYGSRAYGFLLRCLQE